MSRMRCAATSATSDVPTGGRPGRAKRSGMDAHQEWIDTSGLHGELVSRGVRPSYAMVRRSLAKRLGRDGKTRTRVDAAKAKPAPPPSPKQLSFDRVRRPEKRTVEAQARRTRSEQPAPS
jgi:hypothetical protein